MLLVLDTRGRPLELARMEEQGITTARLRLRPFEPRDLPVYAAINADHNVMEYLGGTLTREQSDAEATGASQCYAELGFGKIAVERREDGALLGMCGLSREHWYPDDLEIGWRLAREYWGFGYASEAATAWLADGFERLKLARVISISDSPNLRSIAVIRRLGMRLDHEAELEDDGGTFAAVIYSLTCCEWQTGLAARREDSPRGPSLRYL